MIPCYIEELIGWWSTPEKCIIRESFRRLDIFDQAFYRQIARGNINFVKYLLSIKSINLILE